MKIDAYRLVSPLYRISLLILFGLFPIAVCSAQTTGARRLVSFGPSAGLPGDTLYLDINQDVAVQLLPFDELLKVAVRQSPLLKYQSEVSNSLNSAYQISKVQILQNASGFVNYSGGDQSLIARGVPDGVSTTGVSTIGQFSNGYRAGVDLRITLFDLFGRKHLIRQAQSNYRASVVQKETIELQLKRELITVYQDMITAQQVLKIRLVDEQASLAAYRIAEIELQKGRINAEIMANATTRYVETKSASEQVKGEFLKNIHYFETLTGVPIQRLKRN